MSRLSKLSFRDWPFEDRLYIVNTISRYLYRFVPRAPFKIMVTGSRVYGIDFRDDSDLDVICTLPDKWYLELISITNNGTYPVGLYTDAHKFTFRHAGVKVDVYVFPEQIPPFFGTFMPEMVDPLSLEVVTGSREDSLVLSRQIKGRLNNFCMVCENPGSCLRMVASFVDGPRSLQTLDISICHDCFKTLLGHRWGILTLLRRLRRENKES